MAISQLYTPEGDLISKELLNGYTKADPEYFEERDRANALARGREWPSSIVQKR